jgi:hypothetical protein
MAENGGFGDEFEHLFTGVNGVGKRGESVRNSSPAIPIVAHLCSLHDPSDDTRHVTALTIHGFLLIPCLRIHHKAGFASRIQTRHRLMSWQINGLRDGFPPRAAQRFLVNDGQPLTDARPLLHSQHLAQGLDLGAPGLDRLCQSRRARTLPLPEFYNMTVGSIPIGAVVAL